MEEKLKDFDVQTVGDLRTIELATLTNQQTTVNPSHPRRGKNAWFTFVSKQPSSSLRH
jgi:hypothetical protein